MDQLKHCVAFTLAVVCTTSAGALKSKPGPGDGVVFDCLIEPNLTVAVGSPTRGILDAVLVDRSQSVEQGQLLAVLDAAVERAAVKEAEYRATMDSTIDARKAELNLARVNMQRIQELAEKSMAAHQEMDEARARLLVARTNLQEAKDQKRLAELDLLRANEVLKQRNIVSPVSGVVSQILTHPGEYVEENPILEVAQIDPLRVEVILPIEMFGKVSTGFKAQVIPEAPLSGTRKATVTAVDRVIDAASGTFGVRLELPNSRDSLPGGLKCSIRFTGGEAPGIAASSAAHEDPSLDTRPLRGPVVAEQAAARVVSATFPAASPTKGSKTTVTALEAPARKGLEPTVRPVRPAPKSTFPEPEGVKAAVASVASKQPSHSGLGTRRTASPSVNSKKAGPAGVDDTRASSRSLASNKSEPSGLEEPSSVAGQQFKGALPSCVAVGPFRTRSQASQFEPKLRPLTVRVGHRRFFTERPSQYLVLSADQGSPEATSAFVRGLPGKGVKDYALLRRGPYKDRVSLGLYVREEIAGEHRDFLAEIGIESAVVPRSKATKRVPMHWLVAELRPDVDTQSGLLREIVDGKPQLSVEPRECTLFASK